MSPFQAVYGNHPRAFPTGGGEGTAGDVPAAEQFAEELQALHQLLRDNLERAKSAYKRAADQHRREGESIKVGDKVWLSTQGLPMPGRGKKLRQCRIGPFEVVEQINPVAFRLQLPETMRIHPVFHRSLLSKFREPHRYQQGNRRGSQELPLVDMEHFNEATAILDSRWRGDELQYLVAWEGEPESENTWIPAEDVTKEYLVWEFHELYPDKPKPYRWQMREVLQPTDSEEGDFWGFPSSDADSGGGGNELQGSPHSPTEGVEVEGDIAAAEDWWSRCLPPPWSRKDWEEVFQSSSSSSSADTTIFLGFPSSPGTAGESEGGEWDPAGDLGYPGVSPAKPPQGGKGGLGGGMDVRDWPEPGGVAEGTEASGGHPWTPEEVLRAWEQEEAAPRLSPETGKEVWRSGGEEVSPPVLTEEERVAWEPMGGEENMETGGERGVEDVAGASATTSREDESERDEGNAGASRVKKRKRRSERRRWSFKRLLCWGEKRKPLLGESDSSEEDEV